MSEHDHEYTLTVRPNAHLRVAYSTDDGMVEEAFLAVEYGRDGVEREEGDAGEGIEWRGYEVALARDGKNVLGGDIEETLDRNIERLLGREAPLFDKDDLQRGVDAASGYGRRLKERLGEFRERRARETADPTGTLEPPETIEVSGPGGTTIDASLTETTATFELYEDDGENWRWRLTREDGDTLAVSATGYDSREEAEETITALKANALGADIEV